MYESDYDQAIHNLFCSQWLGSARSIWTSQNKRAQKQRADEARIPADTSLLEIDHLPVNIFQPYAVL